MIDPVQRDLSQRSYVLHIHVAKPYHVKSALLHVRPRFNAQLTLQQRTYRYSRNSRYLLSPKQHASTGLHESLKHYVAHFASLTVRSIARRLVIKHPQAFPLTVYLRSACQKRSPLCCVRSRGSVNYCTVQYLRG